MAIPFSDIPEDLQLRILSFLSPTEISCFSCTSKRFASLCREDRKIWHALCDQKWGNQTQIKKWGDGEISYRLLYKTLQELENLIGFWRLCGRANPIDSSPPLVFFEWGPSFVIGSRVSPVNDDTYQVKKTSFLLMSISPQGRSVNILDLNGNQDDLSGNLVPVDVNFMGEGHIIVEEENLCFREEKSPVSKGFFSSGEEENEDFTEMYTQLANKTSPGGHRRRQRKKRQSRMMWEPEHFIKVSDCLPTITKPLQGLWKGFCDGRNLELYLVKYDEVGGIICRNVEDLSSHSRHISPVFWTRNHEFIRCPFSLEEELILNSRVHISPLFQDVDKNVVSGMLYMNSSYDLVSPGDVCNGRVWLYENGTFGFGFLQDRCIIDLKPVALEDGCLADVLEA